MTTFPDAINNDVSQGLPRIRDTCSALDKCVAADSCDRVRALNLSLVLIVNSTAPYMA